VGGQGDAHLLLVLGCLDELLCTTVHTVIRQHHVVLDVVEGFALFIYQLGQIAVDVVDLHR
jgi:hypothetical protein